MSISIRGRSTITAFAVLASISQLPLAATGASVTLIPSADTSIMEISPNNNMGGVESLAAGVTGSHGLARALVKFDIAGNLPANAVVTGVQLVLPVVREPFLADPAVFSLHRVNVEWGEGNKQSPGGGLIGTGSAATEGEATWEARLHPSTSWGAAGGAAGVDYVAEASAVANVTDTVTFLSTPEMVADVRFSQMNPAGNFGWLIKDSNEPDAQTARRLGSKENVSSPPQLIIEYTEASTLRIMDLTRDSANLCFKFQAAAGKMYNIQRRDNVASGTWTVIQSIPAPAAPGLITVCDPIGPGSNFYRVEEQ